MKWGRVYRGESAWHPVPEPPDRRPHEETQYRGAPPLGPEHAPHLSPPSSPPDHRCVPLEPGPCRLRLESQGEACRTIDPTSRVACNQGDVGRQEKGPT